MVLALCGITFPSNKLGAKDRVANLKGRQTLTPSAGLPLCPCPPQQTSLALEVYKQSCSQGKQGTSGGSVVHNGPVVTALVWQMGRWSPLICMYRLARCPAHAYRNICALVTVSCISQLGWVQPHFGKCGVRFILCLTELQSSLCTQKLFIRKKLPIVIAVLPKHILSLIFIAVTVYSFRVTFVNIVTTPLQQKLNLFETRAAE